MKAWTGDSNHGEDSNQERAPRREGTSVFYSVSDERVFDLLAAGRDIITRRLTSEQSLLHELEAESR